MPQRKVSMATALSSCIVVALANGSVAPRFASAKITVAEIEQFRLEVEAKADVRCKSDTAQQRICDSASEMTIWVFTQPGHAAHPAVSRGTMIFSQTDRGASVAIDRSGHYAGDLKTFDAWMKEFSTLDKRQLEGMSK